MEVMGTVGTVKVKNTVRERDSKLVNKSQFLLILTKIK